MLAFCVHEQLRQNSVREFSQNAINVKMFTILKRLVTRAAGRDRTPILRKKNQQNKALFSKNKALFYKNKALFRIKIFVNFIFIFQNFLLNHLYRVIF